MIWGAGTGVFNLIYSSVLLTDSIVPSPDKAGVFPSLYYTTTFLDFSVTYSYSDTFPRNTPLHTLPMTQFNYPPTLYIIPLKVLSWYLLNCLHFDALYFLAFAFMMSGI